jgi:hypothetical protein
MFLFFLILRRAPMFLSRLGPSPLKTDILYDSNKGPKGDISSKGWLDLDPP